MRSLLASVAVLALLLAVAQAADAPPPAMAAEPAAAAPTYNDAIAAVVGDRVITISDVVAQTRPQEQILARTYQGEELYQRIEKLRVLAARRMIENEIVYREFQERGYTLPPEYLQRRLDNIVIAQTGGDRERFEQKLADDGYTWDEFVAEASRQAGAELLLDEMVRRRVQIGPAAVRQYYQEHQAEFTRPGRIRLHMIYLKKDGRYASQLAETAARIQEQIAQKADFAWLARQYSEGPGADAGGDLGWLAEKDVQPAFLEAVRDLAPGGVSPQVTLADGGLAFLRLGGREAAGLQPLDDALAAEIERVLRAQEEEKRYREYVDGLTRKFHVRIYTEGAR